LRFFTDVTPATQSKEGQRVQVKYHNLNGKMHTTHVRVQRQCWFTYVPKYYGRG